jgi:hypothetical protein
MQSFLWLEKGKGKGKPDRTKARLLSLAHFINTALG